MSCRHRWIKSGRTIKYNNIKVGYFVCQLCGIDKTVAINALNNKITRRYFKKPTDFVPYRTTTSKEKKETVII